MAKESPQKRGRGRPPSGNPKVTQLNVRIDAEIRAAIEAYRAKHDFEDLSDAARAILRSTLRREGLLASPK